MKFQALFLFAISFIIYLLSSVHAYAAHEFSSSYINTYNVDEDAITRVTQQVTLTNLTSEYRPLRYKFVIKNPDIKNIYATDRLGPLKLDITKDQDSTIIEANFNEEVAGINKNLNWTLSYDTKEYAKKNGQIWEINLPGVPQDRDLNSYEVRLKIPSSFGKPISVSPPSKEEMVWTKEEMGDGSIAVVFGDKQLFNFFLRYHLHNNKSYPIRTEIALPPNTPFQNVFLQSVEPKPVDVITDEDGNWLAQYNLEKNETVTVKVSGLAQINFLSQKKTPLSGTQKSQYLLPQKYWEVADKNINALAKKLKTPANIYNYIVNTLSYDYSKVEKGPVVRLGAKNALENPKSAICMEFTDLFIALARSAGIPARELDGFAYTTNQRLKPLSLEKDILHSWPEYYDELNQTWTPVDPTWGNTTNKIDYFHKLDLNHFVFVTKGTSSQYPLPAGSYRESYEGKDVQVDIAQNVTNSNENIFLQDKPDFVVRIPDKVLAGFPFTASVEISNQTGKQIDNVNISLASPDFIKISPGPLLIDSLPPFARRTVNIDLKSKSFLDSKTVNLDVDVNNIVKKEQILIKPVIIDTIGFIFEGGFFGLALLFFILTRSSRGLSLQKPAEESSLRGKSEKPEKKGLFLFPRKK